MILSQHIPAVVYFIRKYKQVIQLSQYAKLINNYNVENPSEHF